MSQPESIVYVIDDDKSVCEAIGSLLSSVGLEIVTYSSAHEFLRSQQVDAPGCLVLDVRLPGFSGLELQHKLDEAGMKIPVIFITGYGDIPMSVRAMKAGAVEFLTKPFRDQELLDAVQQALESDRRERRAREHMAELRGRFEALTQRERAVMRLVISGLLNKQIAAELGTSEITVKMQRAQVMQKMQAGSLAGLVKIAERLGISNPKD